MATIPEYLDSVQKGIQELVKYDRLLARELLKDWDDLIWQHVDYYEDKVEGQS
jgi:hypothetical protein